MTRLPAFDSVRSLDDLDVAIVDALLEDGRRPARHIARALTVSESTVRQRLDRLLADGVVRITAWVEGGTLDRPVAAYCFVRVRGDAMAAARVLADFDEVDWIIVSTDATTIVCSAAVRDHPGLLAFVNERVRPIAGVETVHSGVRIRVWPTLFRYGVPALGDIAATAEPPTTERAVDDIDKTILRALIDNGRTSLTRLAELTGLSLAATRQRYVRLVDDHLVRIECLVDVTHFGLARTASVMVDVDRDSGEVAVAMAEDPDVAFVMELAGVCNILVDVICRDDQHLAECVSRLRALPGVQQATLIPVLAMLKRRVHWHTVT